MVYYVRKNIKLFDDKTFYDYKLCANFVDSQNQVLLDHQRHFRSKFEKKCLKIGFRNDAPISLSDWPISPWPRFDWPNA